MMLPTRIKLLAGTVVVCGGLAAAAVQGVFAAPAPVVTASTATPAATATTTPAISTTAPTTSSAPNPTTGTPPGPRAFHRGGPGPGGFGGPGNLSGLATFLGMTQTDLQTALKNGQTVAQIAQAHGKSSSDLITYLTGQLKTRLDQLVASGKLTSAREATILNNANTRFSKLINLNFQQAMAHRGAGRGHRAPATAPTATPTP
jgi:hypothetical protein